MPPPDCAIVCIMIAASVTPRPEPPSSSGNPRRHHSPSTNVRYDFFTDSGSVTEWVAGSKTGGLRSPST